MFDFSILVTALIAIIIFFFTLYINLKTEIEDLSDSLIINDEKHLKIVNRKRKLQFLIFITIFLVIFIILLYALPDIITIFKKIDLINLIQITFCDVGNFLLRFVPFEKGFFSNSNFTCSYITETILVCVVIVIIREYLEIIFIPTFVFIFIWINYFVSLFLTNCIINNFIFLSIVFNLFFYIVIPFILLVIYIVIDDRRNNKKMHQKKYIDSI